MHMAVIEPPSPLDTDCIDSQRESGLYSWKQSYENLSISLDICFQIAQPILSDMTVFHVD